MFMQDIDLPEAPPLVELIAAGEVEVPAGALVYPSHTKPLAVARQLLAEVFANGQGTPTLLFWRGDWWRYEANHWLKVDELALHLDLYETLESASYMDGQGDDATAKPWNPTPARLTNVLGPLKAVANNTVADTREAPTWLGGAEHLPAGEYLPLHNGLLHLPTLELERHTPELFATYCLPFDYQPGATCPAWSRFLDEVFAHDPKGALLMQEYAGYVISGRTDMHKGLLVVGPSRAGKGIISGTLKQLVGMANTVSPSLRDFATDFGLAGMIGKPFAVVEDARGDDDRRNNALVERLLNITAGDAVQINRKNREHWSGALPTRLMLVSNEMPRFMDASGAVANRFVAVRLELSFLGREDHTLGSRISREMPGVLNWALEGLRRLEQQGHFTVPDTMPDMLEQMVDLAAPVAAFMAEQYTVTGVDADMLTLSEVHRAYKAWCEDAGTKPLAQLEFSRRLDAGVDGAKTKMMDVPGSVWSGAGKRERRRYVLGVK